MKNNWNHHLGSILSALLLPGCNIIIESQTSPSGTSAEPMTMIRPGNSNSGRRALLQAEGCQRGSCWRTASDCKLFQKMWAKSLTQILSIGYFCREHIQKDWVLVNFKRRNVQLGCLWGYRLNDCLEFSSKDSRAKQTIETFPWQRFHGR